MLDRTARPGNPRPPRGSHPAASPPHRAGNRGPARPNQEKPAQPGEASSPRRRRARETLRPSRAALRPHDSGEKTRPPAPLRAIAKLLPSIPGGRGFRHRTQSPPRCIIDAQGHAAFLQMACPLDPSLSPSISAFSVSAFSFSPRSLALLSAVIWRPIRLSSRRISARRYWRPVHKCTARNKPTPAARNGSLLIVLVTLMVSYVFAAARLPAAAVFYGSLLA